MSRPLGAVAAPHPAAAAAAADMLRRGGNAVDAAVASVLACCVAAPGSVGLGGYGGSMIAYLAGPRRVVAIDFTSTAPAAFAAGDANADAYQRGARSITVPAVVAGLDLALTRFGTLPWAVVTEPAAVLAASGVTMTTELQRQLEAWAGSADAVSRHALLPDGLVPPVGSLWPQRDLAQLLRRLASEGPGAFYRGDIPRRIAQQVQAEGGILAESDFERCRATLVEPSAAGYRGHTIVTPAPPAGGLTSLQILKTMEQFPIARLPPWGAEYLHLVAEASKLAWHDRALCLGDPDFVPIPVERLLSPETAQASAERIRRRDTNAPAAAVPPGPTHTVNVITADAYGNVVSLTATHGELYGSRLAVEGLGLLLGHGMSRFSFTPASPNAPLPGKRMLHNMAPTLLLDQAGRAWAGVGLPGGPKIVTVTAQLVMSLVDFRAPVAAAVSAGRVHVDAVEPVAVSSGVSDAVVKELEQRGHKVRRGQDSGGPPHEIGGAANAVTLDWTSGSLAAASQGTAEVVHR
jgi:gamma-glutamyltranspeptidase/glutathione hydrolase